MSNIKRQFLLGMIIVGLVPVILASLSNLVFTRNSISVAKREELVSFTSQVKARIQTVLRNTRDTLKVIYDSPVLVSDRYTIEEKKLEFARMRSYFPDFASLALIDNNGFVLESTDPLEVGERDMTTWCSKALKGEFYLSSPQIDSEPGDAPRLCYLFYLPVASKGTNQTLHVVKAKLNFDRIWNILKESKLGNTGSFVLLDTLKNVLYHSDCNFIYTKYAPKKSAPFATQTDGSFSEDGKSTLIYYATSLGETEKVSGGPWTLIAHIDSREALQVFNQSQLYSGLAAAASLAAAFFLAKRLSGRIARPVVSIAEAAKRLAKSEYENELPEEGPREIRSLAAQFNIMARDVKLHREDLQRQVAARTEELSASERNLRFLTFQLRAAYDAANEAILIVQTDGRVIASSRRMKEFFGFAAEALPEGRSLQLMLTSCAKSEEEANTLWTEVQADEDMICSREWELLRPVARTLTVYTAPVKDENGVTIARLWMFEDITAQRSLESSLRQSSKLEAIGRLAGGVAHDFNNLLTGIVGSLSLVDLDNIEEREESRRLISSAIKAGGRAAKLVKGLLGFSRQSHLKLGRCKINDVMQELHRLLRPAVDPRINIDLDLQESAWDLRADAHQVEQVVLNMVVNAVDVLPLGGNISITTRNVTFSEDQAELMPESRPGEFVRITVTDNGTGMPEEIRANIFEPFFTTKEQGKGTGLGLATSFGIIQQHGGWITFDSIVGQGTTFHIFLPRCEGTSEEAPQSTAVRPSPDGGRETILIVDDEVVVRAVAEGVLKKQGYTIRTASDGAEALEILAAHDGDIQLVLMDMTMPRLSGKDTFCAMRRGVAPKIPVVICSGYLVDLEIFAEETGSKPEGFLQKPYPLEDLTRTVREVLDHRQSVPAS